MSTVLRKTLDDTTRLSLRLLCACVCAMFALVAPTNAHAESRSCAERSVVSPSDAVVAERLASDSVSFRLGNAAKPFGWSTVIGDFNTDGNPDVAVADHIGQWAGSYAYRIEFSMSGQAPNGVTFESSYDAVTISASDVDFDHDLDVVVGVPFSRKAVAVWLNDGHGHFTSVDIRHFQVPLPAEQTFGFASPFVHLAPIDLSRRSAQDGVPAVVIGPAPSDSCSSSVFFRQPHVRSSLAFLRITPRAPPTRSDLLS